MMTSKDSHGSSHLSALLQAAQESKMTLRGEMFSADNMARLSTEFYHMPADVTTSVLSYPEELVKCLLQESPILVPYDKDKNNEPCVSHGHSAHWAVITGFMVPFASGYVHLLAPFTHLCDGRPQVRYVRQGEGRLKCLLTKSEWISHMVSDLLQIYVFARHGQSRHLALWVLDTLVKSNSNLDELDPRKSPDDFIVPEGGLSVGLKSKTVVMKSVGCWI
ncbi:actin maturation protease-like isoform X2 [Corticium candelabrum]|nr:actin maturation protease-like isoform X2 [Corticium candelabrum]XP_062517985.1 actin maturation protease-like isoform X2 [Corticium candelabrum]